MSAATPRRLVFCATAGRSGSGWLAALLGTAEGVVAHHEPAPTMTGPWLEAVAHEDPAASLAARAAVKTPAIEGALAAAPPGAVYVETSHMFLTTFHDVVDRDFAADDVRVVVLRRDLAETLRSMVRLGWFEEPTTAWADWLLDPWAAGASEPPPLERHDAGQEARCVAHLLDVEARAQAYVAAHPGRCVEVRLEELQDLGAVRRLFSALDLVPTDATAALVGVRVNERTPRKRQLGVDYPLDAARAALATHARRYRAADREPPEALARAATGEDPTTPRAVVRHRGVPTPRPVLHDVPATRITQLLNVVAAPVGSELDTAQRLTLRALRRAMAHASALGHHVEVLTTGAARDRAASPSWARWVGPLGRDARALGTIPDARPLPLYADLVAALAHARDPDLLVWSNVDIAPRPDFHDVVAAVHHHLGHDAFVVNRRTVSGGGATDEPLALVAGRAGDPHPGHDCFVLVPGLRAELDLDDTIIGVNWGDRALLWNLAHHARSFAVLDDLAVTFHVGDERTWRHPAMRAHRRHNARAATRVVDRLLAPTDGVPSPALLPWLADLGLGGVPELFHQGHAADPQRLAGLIRERGERQVVVELLRLPDAAAAARSLATLVRRGALSDEVGGVVAARVLEDEGESLEEDLAPVLDALGWEAWDAPG